MLQVKRAIAIATAAAGLTVAIAGPAGAADAPDATLTCGSTTVGLFFNDGQGDWTPVRTTDGRVFVPTAFGDFEGTLRDEEGAIVDRFTEEGEVVKGQGARDKKGDVRSCTFAFEEVSDGSDPEFPAGYTFEGTGAVRGFFRS